MNIALIGPRGSGKTKIALYLSQSLKMSIFSIDALISYEEGGKPIPQILEEHKGDWRYFRDLEFKVLKKAAAMENVILDCGGGIVVDLDKKGSEVYSKRKARLLKDRAQVYYLHVPLEQVVAKIGGDENRPSLSATVSAEEIYQRRLPWYRKVADYELEVVKGNGRRREVADEIAERFTQRS